MSRFSEDNTCNVILIIAALNWCQKHGIPSETAFSGGKECVLSFKDSHITVMYDINTKRFVLSNASMSVEVEASNDEDIVLKLVSKIEDILK